MTNIDAERVLDVLQGLYPEAKAELHFSNPYETLVATILSAQCTDRRVNQVTEGLFERYPDAAAFAETAPTTEAGMPLAARVSQMAFMLPRSSLTGFDAIS